MAQPVLEAPRLAEERTKVAAAHKRKVASRSIAGLFSSLLQRIAANGLHQAYGPELRTSIILANWVTVGYILMILPFGWILRESTDAVVLCLLHGGVYLLSFGLLKKGYHQTGRLIIATFCPLVVYTLAALVYVDGTHSAIAAKILMLSSVVVPLLIFRFKEYLYIIVSVCFICTLLLTLDTANAYVPYKFVRRDVDTPELQLICLAESIVFLVTFFSYYKYANNQATTQIRQLLSDLTAQNEKMARAHAELTASEQTLKEMNESKNRLFSIIAHDLRAPLNSFKGFSGLLSNQIHQLSKEDIAMLVKGMYKSFYNVNILLENLLNWSRTQMNVMKFRPEAFQLEELVNENINLLEKAAQEKEITLIKHVNSEYFGWMDINAFNIVLRNLLTNAIKFTCRGGTVKVRVIRKADFIRIEVTDNGVGMSPDTMAQLFQLNAHHTSLGTANERGTGLGLVLCKEFVEKSGGTIGVESEKGVGSTFYFIIPAYNGELFQQV